MKLTTHISKVRTISRDDPRFLIKDKFTVTPRAGFEISRSCPSEYKSILQQAINAGWIKPVAHVTDRELIFIGLNNE